MCGSVGNSNQGHMSGLKSKPQSLSVKSEEFDGGPNCHLPLHSESSRMLLVHRTTELKLTGETRGIPMALQTDKGLPSDLALCVLSHTAIYIYNIHEQMHMFSICE